MTDVVDAITGEAPRIEIEVTITQLSEEQKGKFGDYIDCGIPPSTPSTTSRIWRVSTPRRSPRRCASLSMGGVWHITRHRVTCDAFASSKWRTALSNLSRQPGLQNPTSTDTPERPSLTSAPYCGLLLIGSSKRRFENPKLQSSITLKSSLKISVVLSEGL